jgi:hypothetical protein
MRRDLRLIAEEDVFGRDRLGGFEGTRRPFDRQLHRRAWTELHQSRPEPFLPGPQDGPPRTAGRSSQDRRTVAIDKVGGYSMS